MATVFTGTIANSLKKTLKNICTDPTDGVEAKAIYKQFCDVENQEDNWEDDLEVAGPGLISEKPEGQEMSMGTILEGYRTRYLARTFAGKLIITEEAIEDEKYDEVVNAAAKVKRALWKTVDIDAALILIRAFNTAYPGGDGLPLVSASHTLPHGGTFSNTLATPLSPSRAAVIVATSQIKKFPGHDGVTEGFMPIRVLCPTEQWAVWETLVKSTHAPEAGEFNAINVVNQSLDLKIHTNQYWNNTTTNWMLQTDAEYGISYRWRRRPRSRTWIDNDQEVMKYGISMRSARGWSNPRSVLGSNA